MTALWVTRLSSSARSSRRSSMRSHRSGCSRASAVAAGLDGLANRRIDAAGEQHGDAGGDPLRQQAQRVEHHQRALALRQIAEQQEGDAARRHGVGGDHGAGRSAAGCAGSGSACTLPPWR